MEKEMINLLREELYPITKELIKDIEKEKEKLNQNELIEFEHLKANVAIYEELKRRNKKC